MKNENLEKYFKKSRKNFPILRKKIIYFDNSATTQKPKQMINQIKFYLENYNSNINRGNHFLGEVSSKLVEKTRQKVADLIKAKKEEIIFTSGTTHSINMVANHIKNTIKKNEEILISKQEHHSNFLIWQKIAKEKKAKLKFIDLNKNFEIDLEELKKQISSKTKIVSLSHISNVLGVKNDIEKISKIIKKKNKKCLFFVDAAQSISHTKINVKKINCDFLCFSAHKIYGPFGLGILYIKEELQKKIEPFLLGGGIVKEVNFKTFELKNNYEKFETGTQNISSIIAFEKTLSFLEKIGFDKITKWEKILSKYAFEKLKKIKNIKLYNIEKSNSLIFSFSIKNFHSHDVSQILNKKKIIIRSGHHCALPLLKTLKEKELCRISLCFYNTKKEIDFCVKVLNNLEKEFNKGNFI